MFQIFTNDVFYCVGVDCLIFGPGEILGVNCHVCNTRCIAERNIKGRKIKYISGTELDKTHDEFYCPKSDKAWHKKGVKLYVE
jgi:hypothetical protein